MRLITYLGSWCETSHPSLCYYGNGSAPDWKCCWVGHWALHQWRFPVSWLSPADHPWKRKGSQVNCGKVMMITVTVGSFFFVNSLCTNARSASNEKAHLGPWRTSVRKPKETTCHFIVMQLLAAEYNEAAHFIMRKAISLGCSGWLYWNKVKITDKRGVTGLDCTFLAICDPVGVTLESCGPALAVPWRCHGRLSQLPHFLPQPFS